MPTAGEIGRAIGAKVIGNAEIAVSGLSSVASAKEGDLVFVDDEKYLPAALSSAAAVVIAGTFAEKAKTAKAVLTLKNPRLGFARAAAKFSALSQKAEGGWCNRAGSKSFSPPWINATAVVVPSASVAASASVDPGTFVGEGASVGERSWIGPGCVIGPGVSVGADCRIYPRVTVYPGTRIGDRVTVHAGAVLGSDGFGYVRDPESGRYEKFPQVGSLLIEDDAEIGANTTIDRGALDVTRIGRGAKIDNLVHIGHNCDVGENVIIAAQAGFSGSITIEDNVVIGGQVGVGEHARIQEGVLLGGQAGVLPKKVLRGKGVAFWGTPAKPLREYLKSLAALARLGRKSG